MGVALQHPCAHKFLDRACPCGDGLLGQPELAARGAATPGAGHGEQQLQSAQIGNMHPLHRAGLFRDLEHPQEVIANLGPNWYASIMGTGIVANAAVTLPRQVLGLHTAALVVCGVAAVMLVALTAAGAPERLPPARRRWDPVAEFE